MSTVGKQEHEKKRKENLHWECPHQIKLKKSGDSPLTNLGIPQGNKHPVKSPLREKMNHIIFCRDDTIDETAFLRNARDSKRKSSKKTLLRKNNFTKKELPRKFFCCEATLFGWRGMKLKQ